jgi:hypothetical protein
MPGLLFALIIIVIILRALAFHASCPILYPGNIGCRISSVTRSKISFNNNSVKNTRRIVPNNEEANFVFQLSTYPTESSHLQGPRLVRSWTATEAWLDLPTFTATLRSSPYDVLLNCGSWTPVSTLQFPSQRHPGRAVQAVAAVAAASGARRVFTFCMERTEAGSLRGCWLTVGVRLGDYS